MLAVVQRNQFGSKSRCNSITFTEEAIMVSCESGEHIFICFHDFVEQAKRLKSFDKWPKRAKNTPEELSHAGFFYTGLGQQVTCFSCGQLWFATKAKNQHVDPWKKHALLSSNCDFLKTVKGSSFIEAVWKEDYKIWLKKYVAQKRGKLNKLKKGENQA